MSSVSLAFLGSHPLGETCLEILTENSDISVEIVVTYPPSKEHWWDGSLYETASNLGHTVVPLEEQEQVLSHDVDYLLSVYHPTVLGNDLLDHPRKLPLNLHQAELPRYRGSNVFTHSIVNARQDDHWKHGTTFHVMAEEVDSGDIIDRRFVDIEETDTAWSLYEKVRRESVALFHDIVPHIANKDVEELRTPQSEFDGKRYFYTKSSVDDLKYIPIEHIRSGDLDVYDRIRAMDFPPHEPAHTRMNEEKVYLTLHGYDEI